MRGLSLVKGFLAEHGTDHRKLFNGSLEKKNVSLRAKLIERLHEAGLNRSEISRVTDLDPSTVDYWLYKETRERKKRSRLATHERHKLYRVWDECAKVLEQRA